MPFANNRPRLLVACEFSGVVRRAFSTLGWEAWSCDLLPAEDDSPNHFQCPVEEVLSLSLNWDLLIAHPPCTYLTNASTSIQHHPNYLLEQGRSVEFFLLLKNYPINHVVIENPTPRKYLTRFIGKPSQAVYPWMFNHKEMKRTCLWLKGLPLLQPDTNLLQETKSLPAKIRSRLFWLPPSPDRWKERSRTYPGIAQAMAQQWTRYLIRYGHLRHRTTSPLITT